MSVGVTEAIASCEPMPPPGMVLTDIEVEEMHPEPLRWARLRRWLGVRDERPSVYEIRYHYVQPASEFPFVYFAGEGLR